MKKIAPIRPSNRFRLEREFLAGYAGTQPQWGPVGFVTYKRTYAQVLTEAQAKLREDFGLATPSDTDTEEFWESLQRVTEGTFSYLKQAIRGTGQRWDDAIAQRKAQRFFRQMWSFQWLPPGRGLQFMGTQALVKKGSAILQNCGFVSTKDIDVDFAKPFCMTMDNLMLGVGMGHDVKGAEKVVVQAPKRLGNVFRVQDSREGWVDALRALLDAYSGKGDMPVGFDYDLVRPAGSRIETFGGTASGPGPLRELLTSVQAVLDARVDDLIQEKDILWIMTLIGRCVVAGNIRRSAEISIGDTLSFASLKDPSELIAAERIANGDGWADEKDVARRFVERHPLRTHLWAANISVNCFAGMTDYAPFAKMTSANGEPGYLWPDMIQRYGRMADAHKVDPDDESTYRDRLALGVNPCGEQSLEDKELCCLVETFPTKCESHMEWRLALKSAFLYGKVVTTIPTHNAEINAVISKNRRIGTSMAGIWGQVETIGLNQAITRWDAGYRYLRELDAEYSGWMGVPRSIKITSVKPGGTIPLLPGVEGGMKIPISRYYYRTIRMGADSPIAAACERAGYEVEADLYSPRTKVVYFPVEDATASRPSKDVSLWEQATVFDALQYWWSDNLVSATLVFQPGETASIKKVLEAYEGRWKGVSFLPYADHGYPQAPYIPIGEGEYLGAIATVGTLDLSGASREAQEAYCEGGVCELKGASN
jgi:ribonucleoside-triphosphate reductase